MKTVAVIGVGYVGLTMATVLANCGFNVKAVDRNSKRMKLLQEGKSGFYDSGLDQFLKQALKSGRLTFGEYEEAIPESELAFICVGTPSKKNGALDVSDNYSAIDSVMKYASDDIVVVQKSTVPVGTGDEILRKHKKISYVASPEFLREGSAIFDTLFFDRIVVGGTSATDLKKVIDVYKKFFSYAKTIKSKAMEEYAFLYTHPDYIKNLPPFPKRVFETDVRSAEMIKIVANSFLATKISFANMCAEMCKSVGTDSEVVLDAVGADRRIGRDFLYPGLGFGGSCLPKDLDAMISLGESHGKNAELLKGVKNVNNKQPSVVMSKIKKSVGGSLRGKKVALLGVSFKAGTSDIRFSPAVRLLELLKRSGAKVRTYDPHADFEGMVGLEKLFDGVDLIVVACEWKEFAKLDFAQIGEKVKKRVVFDTRGILNKSKMEKLGFKVFGL